jgi:hypothetical protein
MSKGKNDEQRQQECLGDYSDESKRIVSTPNRSGEESPHHESTGEGLHHPRTDKWSVYVEDDARVRNEWITVNAANEKEAIQEAHRVTINAAVESGLAPDFTVHVALKKLTGNEEKELTEEEGMF